MTTGTADNIPHSFPVSIPSPVHHNCLSSRSAYRAYKDGVISSAMGWGTVSCVLVVGHGLYSFIWFLLYPPLG